MAVMDTLHTEGVSIIQQLQHVFKGQSELMLFLSHLGDPRNAFLVFFPLAYFWNKSLGVKVMWVAVASEWINAILKWILHGERPYWWVNETPLYDKPPVLEQYRLTCETGPGSPSGHAMVTASVLFLLVSNLPKNKESSIPWRLLGYGSVMTVMAAVCVSRCYISTHFPHQVVLGTLSGYILAELMNHIAVETVSLLTYIILSTVVLVSGPVSFYTIQTLGLDPEWSVSLATKWCLHKDWVYLDTTLFFALVRDAASLLGIGLSIHLLPSLTDLQSQWTQSVLHVCTRTLCVLVSILVTRGQEYIKLPHDDVMLFYTLAFVKYCLIVILVTAVIPCCIKAGTRLVVGERNTEKNHTH